MAIFNCYVSSPEGTKADRFLFFFKWGIPKTMGFNTRMVYIILDDLGAPLGNLHLIHLTDALLGHSPIYPVGI